MLSFDIKATVRPVKGSTVGIRTREFGTGLNSKPANLWAMDYGGTLVYDFKFEQHKKKI